MVGVCEGDVYKVSRYVVEALFLGQYSEIKSEPTMLSSPQHSGVAEKESIDVIFHQSSSDLEMEVYKTSHLEKRREKAKKP